MKAMADMRPSAPTGADRSMEFANNSSPTELRLADHDAPPKLLSGPIYHARADGEARIQQQGAQPAFDLLVDSNDGRGADADTGRMTDAGERLSTPLPGHDMAGAAAATDRIQQQVEGGQADLLVDAMMVEANDGRAADADAGHMAGAGEPSPTPLAGRDMAGAAAATDRTQQQVEGGQADLLMDAMSVDANDGRGAVADAGHMADAGGPPPTPLPGHDMAGAAATTDRIQLQCGRDGSKGGDLLVDATAGPHGDGGTTGPGMAARVGVLPAEARGSSHVSSPAAGADGAEARIQLEGGVPVALLVDSAGRHSRTGAAGPEPAQAEPHASDPEAPEGPDARVLGEVVPTDVPTAARCIQLEGGVPHTLPAGLAESHGCTGAAGAEPAPMASFAPAPAVAGLEPSGHGREPEPQGRARFDPDMLARNAAKRADGGYTHADRKRSGRATGTAQALQAAGRVVMVCARPGCPCLVAFSRACDHAKNLGGRDTFAVGDGCGGPECTNPANWRPAHRLTNQREMLRKLEAGQLELVEWPVGRDATEFVWVAPERRLRAISTLEASLVRLAAIQQGRQGREQAASAFRLEEERAERRAALDAAVAAAAAATATAAIAAVLARVAANRAAAATAATAADGPSGAEAAPQLLSHAAAEPGQESEGSQAGSPRVPSRVGSGEERGDGQSDADAPAVCEPCASPQRVAGGNRVLIEDANSPAGRLALSTLLRRGEVAAAKHSTAGYRMVAGVARYVAGGRTDREEPQAVSSDESSGATSSPDEEEWEEEADLAPPPSGRRARRRTSAAVQADLSAQAHLPPVQRTNGAANEVATEEGEEGEGESDDESDDEELEFPRAPPGARRV